MLILFSNVRKKNKEKIEKFDISLLVVEQNNYVTKSVNAYTVHDLDN